MSFYFIKLYPLSNSAGKDNRWEVDEYDEVIEGEDMEVVDFYPEGPDGECYAVTVDADTLGEGATRADLLIKAYQDENVVEVE